MDNEPVLVVFRKFPKEGDVIALFPEIPSKVNGSLCESYMHVGQHGPANYEGLMQITVPAMPEEYESLRKELTSKPYDYVFNIRKRATRLSRKHRHAAAISN